MTADEERRLKADLLLEIQETETRLALLDGKLKDAAVRLRGTVTRLESREPAADDAAALRGAAVLAPILEERMVLWARLMELLKRRADVFPESRS